ncbi:MAG: hypothetical protein A2Y12_05490 [Planctomycetes bacterium GWF2_42_9]|nr:MAG: hypothetical protein A2Y12_05490 [Planctomycetes bacterium GWF2_42_9]
METNYQEYQDTFRELRREAEPVVSSVAAKFKQDQARLNASQIRLAKEREGLVNLQTRRQKLERAADESLLTNQGDFQKFKTSIRKLAEEEAATVEAIGTLERRVIPGFQKAVDESRQSLKRNLDAFWMKHKDAVESQMKDLLNQIVELNDNYVDLGRDLFEHFGSQFCQNERHLIPEARHDRVGDKWRAISITPRPALERHRLAIARAESEKELANLSAPVENILT